jgi:hypothetical protein
LPDTFGRDNKKSQWRDKIEELLFQLYNQKMSGTLSKDKLRNPVYQNQNPLYLNRESIFVPEVIAWDNLQKDLSYQNIKRSHSLEKHIENLERTALAHTSSFNNISSLKN